MPSVTFAATSFLDAVKKAGVAEGVTDLRHA